MTDSESANDSERSIKQLVADHYTVVYRYGVRLTGSSIEAEDLVQQTFLSAQQKLHQLREWEFARSWLCSIARNHYLKRLRRDRQAEMTPLDQTGEPLDGTGGDLIVDRLLNSEELQHALDTLPEEYRSPLILFYFEEFTYREIADQMETPIGTVMSRLARGRAALKEWFCQREPA